MLGRVKHYVMWVLEECLVKQQYGMFLSITSAEVLFFLVKISQG